jgi:hypothetical protein
MTKASLNVGLIGAVLVLATPGVPDAPAADREVTLTAAQDLAGGTVLSLCFAR